MRSEPAVGGWFTDPRGSDATYRWWDGSSWTRWLSDDEHAAAPVPADPDVIGDDPAVRTPIAVALTVIALVLALVAVGITVSFTNQKVIAGPAVDPPAPPPAAATIDYGPALRTVRVRGLRLTVPAAPYACDRSTNPPSYFSKAVICSTVVHRNYVKGQNTYNNLAVGLVDENLIRADLRKTGEAVFLAIRRALYTRDPGTLSKFTSSPTSYGPAEKVLLFNGQVDYRVTGLPSRFDRLVLVIAKLDDDTYAVVFANQADDTAKSTRTVLVAALESFTIR